MDPPRYTNRLQALGAQLHIFSIVPQYFRKAPFLSQLLIANFFAIVS